MALPAGRYGVTKRQLNKVKNLPVNTIGMIEETLETSKEYTDDAIGWGSANILNADALFANASHHGISLSISNQIVGLIGTVSSDVGYYFGDVNKTLVLPAGTYTFSIVVSGNFGTASEIRLRKRSDSSRIAGIYTNDVKPISFTLDTDTEVFIAIVNSNVPIGTSVNATLKLQLEKGSTATAYEPYHPSVLDSLAEKCDNSVIAPVENHATCQNPDGYAVGEHFIRNRKFCTVIASISSGATLTLNTNYVEGDIASELTTITDACTDIITGATADVNVIKKYGNVIYLILRLSGVSASAWVESIAIIPSAYRPKEDRITLSCLADSNPCGAIAYHSNGNIKIGTSINDKTIYITGSWIL